MNALKVGLVIRALRRKRGWRQVDVAARANVPRSTISRIERGSLGSTSIDVVTRVASVLGVIVDLVPRWQGESLDRLLDEAHAGLVEGVVRLFRASGWDVGVEVSFSITGERGSIDVLAFHAATATVAVCEVKTVVPDVQAMLVVLDRKTRLAMRIAAERDWHAKRLFRLLVVNDDRTSRRRVERHAAIFEAAFPVRGHASRAWIRDPASQTSQAWHGSRPGDRVPVVSALLFLSAVHRVNGSAPLGGRHRVVRAREPSRIDAA